LSAQVADGNLKQEPYSKKWSYTKLKM
jgi:hypothetical protein